YVDGRRGTRASEPDRIAVIHMSGLFDAIMLIAGQDGFRDASAKQPGDLVEANGSRGLSRVLDRSIIPSALAAPVRLARAAFGQPNS
ncbi:hypothetical protein, partial [Bradyrhizobium altum]|uniref:hypothetical protein n=1 Tax=Bradyrhizobium altum TaxID=1571202 RepID=UPI001E4DE2BE